MNRTMFPLPNWPMFWRRVRNTWRTLFTSGDFSTLIVTCMLMVVPVLALNASLDLSKDFAQQSVTWRVSLSQLIPVAILSVLFGFLLARSHYSEGLALILSAIYALATITIIQFIVAPGNPVQRFVAILTRFYGSLNSSIRTNTLDPYLLVLFLSVLIWFLGHNTAWHTFRLDRVWRAILPPGIVLVLNGFYNLKQPNLDGYLIVYVFLSLWLIVRSHIEAREFDWYMNHVSYLGSQRNLRAWFFRSSTLIAVVMVVLAWTLPTGSPEESAKRFQQFLNGEAFNKLTQLLNKLFGSLESEGAATADYYGGDTLTLGGALQLGDQIVMVVKAPPGPHYYWKSRVFDRYQLNTWSSPRNLELSGPNIDFKYPPIDSTTRRNVSQQFTMAVSTSGLVYAAPQPLTFNLPIKVEMDYVDEAAQTINPSVTRQMDRLSEGDSYTVTSSISTVSAAYLRNVPPDVPDYLQKLDLPLPPSITARTRTLAAQIVQQAKAQNNYDKAKAIEQWLRTNIRYNESILNPPADRDLVDWVLFDQKEGYCTYYASAMVIMLRSVGVPARMAAGFSQGIYDQASQTYVVRERDAHTWVEVYFGSAGWVEFEPTSAQNTADHVDPSGKPTTTPPATNTPTATLTPLPSPTSTQIAGAAVITETPPLQQPQATFTYTPLPTVTTTATPIPVPPIQVPPPVQAAFNILLLLAVLIGIISFLAVGVLWWVEYRGLDRVSPVGRAYARLAIYAGWLGIALGEANTPLERGRRISKEVPNGNRPVTTITDMYITERYARPRNATFSEEDHAQNAWKRARRAFFARKFKKWFRRK
ncbi:MAG: transglutaminase domain-containing protein [Chloroflexota bacterium]